MIVSSYTDTVHSKAVPDLIAKMLTERQEMLVLFNRLASHKPYTSATPVQPLLKRFCQVLMDYIALGHFEVYQCIETDCGEDKTAQGLHRLSQDLYPQISQTTEVAVAFNDRYENEQDCRDLGHLDDDLSGLGERLADRIELEDRLISAISNVEAPPA